jgi:hypothetical protein
MILWAPLDRLCVALSHDGWAHCLAGRLGPFHSR